MVEPSHESSSRTSVQLRCIVISITSFINKNKNIFIILPINFYCLKFYMSQKWPGMKVSNKVFLVFIGDPTEKDHFLYHSFIYKNKTILYITLLSMRTKLFSISLFYLWTQNYSLYYSFIYEHKTSLYITLLSMNTKLVSISVFYLWTQN